MAKKKGKRRISHAGARKKGHDFERWVAGQMRRIFPDALRHLEYQMGEANGCDVVNTGNYRIQCKRGRRYASITAIKEVQICPIDGGVPVLVTRGDETEAMAVLPFEHLIKLLKKEKLASK